MLAALDPDARPPIPFSYFVDQMERRYGCAPGSSRDWPVEDFIRAAEFMRLEGAAQKKRSK